MHVGKRKWVGLYACNCAKCKTAKMKCFYSYLTVRRHRNIYGTSTAEVNEMDREGCAGYRQLPVHPDDFEKTVFCPGPGLGLFQFRCMPFGLTGAPGSFQRLINKINSWMLQRRFDSFNQQRNAQDPFRTGFQRNKEAGLTLKGCKCHIGKDEVIYLEHVFSANGMRPDEKIAAVKDWPTPKDATEIRQFLDLRLTIDGMY
ncbi:hypothetical protein EMCRGX_G018226 [Ephydatia muelleri]